MRAPAPLPNWPGSHACGASVPGGQYVPGGHFTPLTLPVPQNLPAKHKLHVPAPSVAANRPASHALQSVSLAARVLPAAQRVHTTLCPELTRPGGHERHSENALSEVSVNVFRAHVWRPDCPAVPGCEQKKPPLHAEHSVTRPVSEYQPAGHASSDVGSAQKLPAVQSASCSAPAAQYLPAKQLSQRSRSGI